MPNKRNRYSLVIIGAGPAGLTASIYASRFSVDNLIIGGAMGGLAFEAHKICNFPTEPEISGMEIIQKMQKHVENYNSPLIVDKVTEIQQEAELFKITTRDGKVFLADTVLLAIGTQHRKLNLHNEEKFLGKGVSYCATCDAMFYKDKIVAVVGGSDSAHTASLYLADIAKKVYQIYREDKFRGEVVWIKRVIKNKKIEVIYNTKIVGLNGNENLKRIILDKPYKGKKEIDVDGLFVEIGTVPEKILAKKLRLKTNEMGYIKVGDSQSTSQKGIWAAGDITDNSDNFRQILTACSEGAIAAKNIFEFLKKKEIV